MIPKNKYGQPKLAVRRQMFAGCYSAFYTLAAACWARLTNGCRQRFQTSTRIEFVNESTRTEACVSFSNEVVIGADGWAQIAPFGDFPSFAVVPQPDGSIKRLQAIQRIDKECATQMVNEFQSARVSPEFIHQRRADEPTPFTRPDVKRGRRVCGGAAG